MLNTSARRATRTPPRCGSVVGAGGPTDVLARASRNFPPRCRPCGRPGGRVGALTGRRAEPPTVCAPAGYYGPLAPLGLGGYPTRRARMPPLANRRRHCVGCEVPRLRVAIPPTIPRVIDRRFLIRHAAGQACPGTTGSGTRGMATGPAPSGTGGCDISCARRSLISAGVPEAWAGRRWDDTRLRTRRV
jgi:hypothetical protein